MSQQSQKQSKSSKKTTPTEEKQFSSTVITNFLNNYYRNVSQKQQGHPSLSFKSFPDESKAKKASRIPQGSIIDLWQYQGLIDFIETYKAAKDAGVEKIENIIDMTFDMKLRACFDVARVFKTNDKTKLNAFQEFVLPQLGFNTDNQLSITNYINGVSSYFANEAKLKTKIYNTVFPHASHNPEKLPRGVNVIYLQHVSKYHDDVLDMVITKNWDEGKVLEAIQKQFTKDSDASNDVKLQLSNPAIAKTILEPPTIKDKRGKEVIDAKWIDRLKAVQLKGKKLVETDRELTNEEKRAVRALSRELMIVKSFVKIIQGARNAQVVGKNEKGEEIPVPANVDLSECLTQYHEVYDKTIEFFNNWKKTIDEELERIDTEKDGVKLTSDEQDESKLEEQVNLFVQRSQYELFLRYFVDAVRFVKNELKYSQPFKSFVNDVKKDIVFKFNKNLRSKLEELISAEAEPTTEKLAELAADNYKDWMFINSPKTYNPNDLAVYSKIGKFCQLDIRKEYRVAIGIAIVAFIQERIALIDAANRRKKELQLYIRV